MDYSQDNGGVNVLYYLAKLLDESGKNVRIYASTNNVNPHFNKFFNNDFDVTEAITIYCEGTNGNPLNSKYVVRWILSPIGLNVSKDICKSWGENELIYYFNFENRFDDNSDYNSLFKLLPIIIINPILKNLNLQRNGLECFTFRKSNFHKEKIKLLHKEGAFEIGRGETHESLLKIFNEYSYFYSYDPLTFISIIAALCGCVSIVYPIANKSKVEWIKETAAYPFIKETNQDLYGIAYGMDDIENAKNTISKVEQQWKDIIEFNKNKFYNTFLNDLNYIQDGTLPNTIKNITTKYQI